MGHMLTSCGYTIDTYLFLQRGQTNLFIVDQLSAKLEQ